MTFERKASQLAKYASSYCGRECRSVGFRRPNPALITGRHIPCERCGREVWRTPATEQPHTYCSHTCSSNVPRRAYKDRVVKPCANCHAPMRMLPADAARYRFCSRRCAQRVIQGAKAGLPGVPWTAHQRIKLSQTLRQKWGADWAHRIPVMSEAMSGSGNHRWRDGRTRTLYAPGFTKRLKYQIAKRDLFLCRRCGAPWVKGAHAIHHIDGMKHDHSPANLVLLCNSCHGKTHALMDGFRSAVCTL